MKIKYVTVPAPQFGNDLCQTPCPFYPEIKVDSIDCAGCQYYCEKSTDNEVECKHPKTQKSTK
jgi:hypothetical protein